MTLRRRTALLAAGTAMAVAACGHTAADSSASEQPTSAAATPSITPGYAPDGTPIPSRKPTWLDGLPDPATIDRTDPEAVITAYVITAETWDTTIDKTSAYASQRAAIYRTTALRAAAEDYDPDTAKAQGAFLAAAKHDSYTTVTIREIVKEGLDPDQDGDYRRIVHYLITTTPRDGSTTSSEAWDAWVTTTREDGQWAIASMQTQPTEY
ncbi:hypothetical protein GZ998_08890 [Actinomyces sp. 594]|uniref:hypothetical protein n=1 Tax=Actinomyces sp. 594 TaxID=2057793 RepID=UPI001C56D147|nr:hypothetical protein [Actinomyces sp. 594]MBW3069616.1 hypothetical protein [Actinomyces sp. 594]